MRHGFLFVHKPIGPTSHDIVGIARKKLGERSIGHLGTLDPAAEGLMVLAVGKKALKCIELFERCDKCYEAEITLGAVSTTYDREGVIETVERKAGQLDPAQTDIQNMIADYFVGDIDQVPPRYSALKVNGERAYKTVRQGGNVEIQARPVHIYNCELLRYDYPTLVLSVHCGSGTYIRSLAHDLGQQLRCGGYLSGLKRTQVGPWQIDRAIAPDEIDWPTIIPLKEVLKNQVSIELNDAEYKEIEHGRPIQKAVEPNTIAWFNEYPVAVLTPKTGITEMAHPRKVLS